jgi:CHAT domain-containing protein
VRETTGGSSNGEELAKVQRGSSTEKEAEPSLEKDRLTRSATEVGFVNKDELRFPRLFFTRREADSILRQVPKGKGVEFLDFQASRATAKSLTLAQYRILHFATHGLIDSTHPELSGIVLSLVDEHGNPQNGFLTLEDIYNLKLNAEVVVLSACQTALGKDVKGEGLVGLTRGFMYAGAPRVIASLWNVDDWTTSELMRNFYKAMFEKNLTPAAALRYAQIETLKRQWRPPYYWASFVLQGEWK